MLVGEFNDTGEDGVAAADQMLARHDRVDQILGHHRRPAQRVRPLEDDVHRDGRARAERIFQEAGSCKNVDHSNYHGGLWPSMTLCLTKRSFKLGTDALAAKPINGRSPSGNPV